MLTIKPDAIDTEADYHLGPAPHIVTPPPGFNARQAVDRDELLTSPSYTRPYPLVVDRARGSIVQDVDGNRYLDFTAGIAVCAVGHCHPLVVKAIQDQADKLIHMCGSDFYYEPMIRLAEKLAEIAPMTGPLKLYFGNSGAEATEAAIKLARWHTKRKWIIGFYGSFHGRTMGALSITSSKARQRAHFGPFVPMVAHAPYGSIEAINEILFKQVMSPNELAAVIVEPIQGEGGYVFPPPHFLADLRSLCDKAGALLIADECQTGMGRTGKWWACQHYGVEPDILLTAKALASGLPLSAMIAKEEMMRWPEGAHGSTFGGNPVACAAAIASIELIESQYMENAAALESVGLQKLRQIAAERTCLDNVRGKGLMLACDVVSRRSAKSAASLRERILEEAFRRGLLLLGCGEHSIRFIPPLCMNRSQLEVGFDVFSESVATAESL
jgi:4-aminobutyrate aminotransferase